MSNKAVKRAANLAGNQSKLAASLQVKPQTVSEWARSRRDVPEKRCIQIETITKGKVTRKMLRKDWRLIWPD